MTAVVSAVMFTVFLHNVYCNVTVVSYSLLKLIYATSLKHPDHYSRTKAEAEMRVLAANDSSSEDSLRTCALRLAGVYGPGEERHLPRVVVSATVPN